MVEYFAKDPESIGLSVSALVWRDGRLLLVKRSDNGHWGLPGGFVEPGESVAEAAVREVAEETGYRVELGALVGVYSSPRETVVDYSKGGSKGGVSDTGSLRSDADEAKRSRGRIQLVNLCFHARALQAGEATTPEETLEMGFFDVKDLPEPFVPIHRIRIEDGLAGSSAAIVR